MAKLTNPDEVQTGPLPAATRNPFKPAHLTQSRVRMALTGPTGSGKTYTALAIATALSDRVAVVDTEQGSASLYRKLFSFDVVNLSKYTPRYYIQMIEAAAAAGYGALVIDSLSPSWNGTGGILEIAGGNIRGWKDATPEYNSLVQTLIRYRSKMHIIATLRSKMKHALETDESTGRLVVRKLGLEAIHRDELPYEFDIIGDLTTDHAITFSKSRCAALDGRTFTKPGSEVATIISEWLTDLEPETADEGAEDE